MGGEVIVKAQQHHDEYKKMKKRKLSGGRGLSRKCECLVKEQRARIYILRRCATMLLCWYIQGSDD